MTPIRRKQIRRQLLEILAQAAPYLLPETTLFSNLTLVIKPPPTLAEFEEVIAKMETARVVVRIRTEDEVKTKITDEGSAELLQ